MEKTLLLTEILKKYFEEDLVGNSSLRKIITATKKLISLIVDLDFLTGKDNTILIIDIMSIFPERERYELLGALLQQRSYNKQRTEKFTLNQLLIEYFGSGYKHKCDCTCNSYIKLTTLIYNLEHLTRYNYAYEIIGYLSFLSAEHSYYDDKGRLIHTEDMSDDEYGKFYVKHILPTLHENNSAENLKYKIILKKQITDLMDKSKEEINKCSNTEYNYGFLTGRYDALQDVLKLLN